MAETFYFKTFYFITFYFKTFYCKTFYCKTFLFMFFLLSVSASDPEVSCVFRQSCLLPCQIQLGSDPLIHWYQVSAGDLLVHSYYHNKDQLGKQNQNFKNRTSLILDQISTGNASLLLKEVKIQDEGRYKCYTSTSTGYKESFINLQTEAPVSDIRIHQDGNRITCSSEGIYPQPELTWSTEPPSNTTLNETTRIQKTEDQLYNISSSLTGPDGPDLTYSCSIRTRRNQKTETFIKPESVQKDEDLPWWLIGGLIAAAVAVIIIIGVTVWYKCKKRKRKERKTTGNKKTREENTTMIQNMKNQLNTKRHRTEVHDSRELDDDETLMNFKNFIWRKRDKNCKLRSLFHVEVIYYFLS
ncbi:CD276 antigen-like [Poecilia latipinna]|uniref:CD276 antigen-like n=1 Tax=Poecilia latipinna TaxID=48699 RepID=UPI00072E1E94|nr:PREDICTED: CD276 antigen-like [Poecilia latipinna]